MDVFFVLLYHASAVKFEISALMLRYVNKILQEKSAMVVASVISMKLMELFESMQEPQHFFIE